MTTSRQIKGLLAGVAAIAVMGTAMAQGTPPNAAVKSAPVGAGQQSSQKTPMGETGTPGSTSGSSSTGSSAGSASNSGASGSTSGTGSTGGTSMGASGSTDSTMASSSGGSKRRMRADRN